MRAWGAACGCCWCASRVQSQGWRPRTCSRASAAVGEHAARRTSEEHGLVCVMPTGMHHSSILAAEAAASRLLGHLQRVHVSPQCDDRRAAAADFGHDARACHRVLHPLDAHIIQPSQQPLARLVLLERYFWVGVKLPGRPVESRRVGSKLSAGRAVSAAGAAARRAILGSIASRLAYASSSARSEGPWPLPRVARGPLARAGWQRPP